MAKDDKENKNKDRLKNSIFSKISKIIINEKEDTNDKYIIDAKSDDVVDKVTLSKRSISEDTKKARDFLKNLSSQKDLGKPENINQNPASFAKRILEERKAKNKDSRDRGN
jgi:hypothetical protein